MTRPITTRQSSPFYPRFLKTTEEDTVVVLTDHPNQLKVLSSRILIISIDPDMIEEWKGDHHFSGELRLKHSST